MGESIQNSKVKTKIGMGYLWTNYKSVHYSVCDTCMHEGESDDMNHFIQIPTILEAKYTYLTKVLGISDPSFTSIKRV